MTPPASGRAPELTTLDTSSATRNGASPGIPSTGLLLMEVQSNCAGSAPSGESHDSRGAEGRLAPADPASFAPVGGNEAQPAPQGNAPAGAPDGRAVVELLAWLDAVATAARPYTEPPSPALLDPVDVGVMLPADDGKYEMVPYPPHAAATVRGLVEAVGQLRAENERLRLPFPFEQRGYVLGAAVRYQLGRRTYGSGIVADAVVAAWPTLHSGVRSTILRDVREAFDRSDVGDVCDAEQWRRILALDATTAAPGGDAARAGEGHDAA